MRQWILPYVYLQCLALVAQCAHGQGSNGTSGPAPEPTPSPTPVPDTPSPTVVETPAPTPVPDTPAPTLSPTPEPTPAPTPAPTTPGPSPAPTLAPTNGPTLSPTPTPTRFPGTFAPTPPPTFPYNSFCERPYPFTNESDTPCVDMVSYQDMQSGVGAFYDETGCAWQERGRSVVGCALGGVSRCRLCVFNRALYSATILGGDEVPFVDCPCCVPEVYEMGGDIDCDFQFTANPILRPIDTRAPTVTPVTQAPTPVPGSAAGANRTANATTPSPASTSTSAPTIPPIPMEPCEIGAGGAMNGSACSDLATTLDLESGIGYYYEQGCEGLGCGIFGSIDCRQCLFDRSAYTASDQTGGEDLVDCPCCVPITYQLRPDDTSCIWPPTPAPTAAPTTLAEAMANGATGLRRRDTSGWAVSVVGAVVSLSVAVGIAGTLADLSA